MAQYFPLFGPLVLIFLSIPLAIFAAVTTTLAFSTLLLRVSIVYLELGLGLVHGWLSITPSNPKTLSSSSPRHRSGAAHQELRRRASRGFSPSNEVVFIHDNNTPRHAPSTLSTSESFTSLLGSGGPSRDFEGVGGWRLTSDPQDDAIWMGTNSRLQLPAPVAAPPEKHRRRKRSLTSQSQRMARSPEAFRMSPVNSRNRTPPATQDHEINEEYFNIQEHQVAPLSPEEVSTRIRMNERRLSIGSSAASSVSDPKASTSALMLGQPP